MKLLIVVIVAVCFSITVNGQMTDIFKRNPMKEYKLKRLLEDSLQRIQPVPPSEDHFTTPKPGVIEFPLKGRFIGKNGKGDEIYQMQPDNIPCLVPGKKVDPNMVLRGIEKKDNPLPFFKKHDEKTGEPDKDKQDK